MHGPAQRRDDDVLAVDLRSCLACGAVCEVTGTFTLPSPLGGHEDYVRTVCALGHRIVSPAFAVAG